jgi:hypothetical protein
MDETIDTAVGALAANEAVVRIADTVSEVRCVPLVAIGAGVTNGAFNYG